MRSQSLNVVAKKPARSPIKGNMTPQEQNQKRMRNELLIILNDFIKAEIMLKDKTVSYQKKQLIDPDKWRKKFRYLFEREKIFNFDLIEGSAIF